MLLLLPKVAQKHRTASLSGAECAKSKTNATRPKHLASLFLDAFAPSARRDCASQSLVRRRCKVRTTLAFGARPHTPPALRATPSNLEGE